MSKFLLIFLCFSGHIFAENISYILVHGTWAKESQWYQESGNFFDALSCVIDKTDEIIPFSWSGICLEIERRVAAFCLVELLKKEIKKNKKIVIVAHSHGGNVVFHALEFLRQHHKEIFVDFLILLGTPIAHNYDSHHVPVGAIINLFSFGDLIQPVFGLFKRTIFAQNILNFELIINKKHLSHHQLYHPLVAFYLPKLLFSVDIMLKIQDKTKIYTFNLDYYKGISIHTLENGQEKLIQDQIFQEYLLSHLLWGKEEALYFLP